MANLTDRLSSIDIWRLCLDHGQLFLNLVKEGLPTICELPEKHQALRRFMSNWELLILTAVS